MRRAPHVCFVVLAAFTCRLPAQPAPAAAKDRFRPPAIMTEGVPPVPADLWDRLRQYQNVRSASFADWAPDGKGILIATQFGNTTQLHRVYQPGGRREQITFFDEPVRGFFIPRAKDGALLLSMSKGGNENYQTYLLEREGKAVLLSDGKSRNQLEAVRPDGGQIVVGSNKANGRDTDLYIGDPRRPGSLKMLMPAKGEFWSAADWSQDGSKLLLNRYVSINETYPALLDVTSGQRKMLPMPMGGTAATPSAGKSKVAFWELAFYPTAALPTSRPTPAASSRNWPDWISTAAATISSLTPSSGM
jgi:hypothetical protein